MKQLNCRLDFLPNKQNKYSIRKFTVGTASTLVGAAFMFGFSHDAQAAEEQPSSTDITHIQSESPKLNSDITSQSTKTQETQLSAVVTPPVTTEAPASENTAPHNPESNTTTSQTLTTIESAPQLQSQSKEIQQSQKDTTSESISTIVSTPKPAPIMHTRTKRSLDLKAPVEQTKAPVSHETYSGRIIDYTRSDLVTKVEHPGQTVAPDYIDFSPVFKDSDSKTYAFLTNKGTVASKKVTTTNGGGIHAYQGDYITLNDTQPEAYVYINNVGIANGHKVDAWIHVKMDSPSTHFPTNVRYFFTSGRDMLSMTSQDGGGATAHIKFLSNIDKSKLEELYNSVAIGTSIDTVKERIESINNTPHPVSGLLNIYDLDDYDPHKATDVRKSVTFNRNDINELYISNKVSSEATANLELKDNKIIISTGEHPKGGVDDYPNRVTAAFKNKRELTYSMTGRNVSGTAFHVKGILLVPVQPYTVQVHNSIDKQDTKVSLTQYIPTREVHQTATLPSKIEMTAEFPQGIVANVQPNTAYFTATQNNSNKVIIAHSNTALKQQAFYDKTYTLPMTLKHNLTVEDIRSNSEKWTKLKTYYDGNVLNVPVKWSFDNGTKQFENLITDYQTIPLALSDALKNELDKQIMAEATASVEAVKRAHAHAQTTAQTITTDQLVSKNEVDGLKNEIQAVTTQKNDAQAKVNHLPERLKTTLQQELNQLTTIGIPEVNDEDNNAISDDQDKLIAEATQRLTEAQEAETKAKKTLTEADVNHAISSDEHQHLAALQQDFTTKKKAAESKIKAIHAQYQSPLIEKLNQLVGITVPEVNDTNHNGKPDVEDEKAQQDAALKNTEDLVRKAEVAEQAAETQLQQVNKDNLIKPQEHQDLIAKKANADTTKATANAAIKVLPQALQASLLERLTKLKEIIVPDINDNNDNNIPDNQDTLIAEAKDLLAAAKAADKLAKSELTQADGDKAINQQEHDRLANLQQDFTTKKKTANDKIEQIEGQYRGNLPTQLESLNGIVIPDINDKNSNMVPDSQDTLVQTAEAAIEKAEAADALAKNELAKIAEPQVISPKTHQILANLQQDFEQKKAAAQQVLNAVDSTYQGTLPGKLKVLTGIAVPEVNDKDENGRPDVLEEKAQQVALKAATALVEQAELADKTAQTALQTAQANSLITPKEHTDLASVEAEAVSTKAAANQAVNDLSPDKQALLMDRLVKLTGIIVPSVTDNNENNILDTEDQLIQEAEDFLKQAQAADQKAKAMLAEALNPSELIDATEHQALLAVQTDFEQKKAAAHEKINAIQDAYRKDLPQQLAALTGIKVPEINDEDKNGIRDDVDQAIHKAKAAVEAAKATYHNALTQAEDIQKDGIITPEENTELSKTITITLAETKKADAQAQVNVVLSEPDKHALQAELDALTTIKTPQVNDENHNGVPDQADRLFDEAVKAYEAAKAAEVKAQSVLEDIQKDGVVNSDEQKQVNALQLDFKQKQAFATAKIKEVDSQYRQGLPEKLQTLTGINIPSVNDQNRNGIRDDIDASIDKAQQFINVAKDSEQAAHSKLDEVTADGLINPNELASLNEAKNLIGVKKLEAQTQIDALPSPYQKDLQLQLNAIDEITLPAVNDQDNNQVDDHTDALKTAIQGLIDEAKRVHKSAQQRLVTAQQDELITPKEWSELNHQASAAKSAVNDAQKAVDKIDANLRPEFQTQLDLLKVIDLPEINDTDSNGMDDKQDQFIRDALQALKATQAAEDVAKAGLATAQNNDVINVDEHAVLSNLQTAFLAHKKMAEEKVALVNTSLASGLSKMLDALTGIEVPVINDYNYNDVDDVLDQTFQDSIDRVKAAYQTFQDDLAQVNADSLVTPNEQAALIKAQNHVVQLKEQATETLQQSSLPTAVKTERLDALSHVLPISIPEINDQNENGVEDSVDARVNEAKVAVSMAQKADKHAQLLFDSTVSDNLITPEEQASLKVAQDRAQTLKTFAETKVNGLPNELKGDLPTLLAQLKGITLPEINDANTNGTNDIQDQWVNNAKTALKQAISIDNAAQMELAKVLVDHRVQSEEHEALAIIQENVKAAKLLAQVAIAQLPTELKGNLISALNLIKNIEIPTVTEDNITGSVETIPNEVQQDEFGISHSHATQQHLENTEKTSRHQMISKTHTTHQEVEQEVEVKDKNTHQDMAAREAVSSEKSSLTTDKHHETTQAYQIDEGEAASSESINDFQNNEAHTSQTLNHTTTKTSHLEHTVLEHTVSSQHQKVLPHTGKLVSNGILGGSIVVLIGLASLVSRRRRKN